MGKKDYSISFILYGLHEDGIIAFQDNYKVDHQRLNVPDVNVILKKVRDEDMINRNLIGKNILADRYDYWVKSLKNRLKLKKDEEGKITNYSTSCDPHHDMSGRIFGHIFSIF